MEQDDDANGSFVNIGSGQIDGLERDHGGSQDVITNPLILSNIFSHLEFPDLIKLRLVCKVWDEVVRMSPEFRKMFRIHVTRLFPCCAIGPVPDINPNLAKNIYLTNGCWSRMGVYGTRHDPRQTVAAAAYNVTTFFNQYHHDLENIKFELQYSDSFHTSLVKALKVLDFPKLQGIAIKDVFKTGSFGSYWGWKNYRDDPISTSVTYLPRPNLISLQLDNTVNGSPFHDIFQKLINSAPNLEKITMNGNFYPDLSTCKNLKILNYSGIPYYYKAVDRVRETHSFNLGSLSRMLDQAKDSLIELSLKDSYLDCTPSDTDGHSQLQEFKFPDVAAKLTILRIQENSKPFFQPELKTLNPEKFPELKNLSIAVKSLDNVLVGISHSFVTVSYLRLSGTISPDVRQRIPILFPNLTSLTMPWSGGTLNRNPDFDAVIDLCSGWKLRELNIATALQSDWCTFLTGLGRLKQTQNDIRMLELPSQNNVSLEESKPTFELWYDARNQQQPVGTMNMDIGNLTFGPHSMKKAMGGAVLEFILKHPLKVHFI